jgi:tRNA(fMet)-specific endonuclease VapC
MERSRMPCASKDVRIPENDLWIAAIALEHDLVVATRDVHFGEIDNLKVEMWLNQ